MSDADDPSRHEPRAEADLAASNIVIFTQPTAGKHDPARAAHELKERISAHKHEREIERARHELDEAAKNSEHRRLQEAKDNDLRRRAFYGIGLLVILALIVGTVIASIADNSDTRRWAQGVVVALLSGVIGAAAGWFSHKGGT